MTSCCLQKSKAQIENLINRCEAILNNPLLEEKFTQRYVSITCIYAGLLCLVDKSSLKKGIEVLENLLLFYQQVSFHSKIDSIYWVLLMGNFCLQDYKLVEKSYRRYKKSIKGKTINAGNDKLIHGFYFASKWLETGRALYAKKYDAIIQAFREDSNQNNTAKVFYEIATYYKIPVEDLPN